MNQASQRKQISFPLLKNFYIWRRNSKSPDADKKGMAKYLRLIRCLDEILKNL